MISGGVEINYTAEYMKLSKLVQALAANETTKHTHTIKQYYFFTTKKKTFLGASDNAEIAST